MNQWINESSVPKTAHQPLKLDCNLKRDMHWSSSCTEEASVSKGMHKELNLIFLRLDFVIYLLNLTSYASDWLKNISWQAIIAFKLILLICHKTEAMFISLYIPFAFDVWSLFQAYCYCHLTANNSMHPLNRDQYEADFQCS